ncbi:translocation/assembly module TamB domain-containing protein [Vibrio tapetis subsp. quintayensis]|uniref:autotransporter assembly complex protein TamB n=1 Tax=Vibrio tapetis TaxID=52443 RepID=UPI0025B2907D|nr:translocation/assembly module TamB domain-containing protein [Vibrio tapetis]MDN3680370.1 translocation/assembly module TamB domain-containing protein [Vibrio tapetis subsp. quintayensis]
MRKSAAKWLVRLALTIPTLILIVLLLLGGLLFTNTGLKLALWGAEKALPQLQVTDVDGALMTGFQLSNVAFVDPDLFIDLAAEQVELNLDAQCLLTPAVCIDKLRVSGLKFALTGTAESEAPVEGTPPLTEITLPLPVAVKSILLNDIQLDILGTQVEWQHFSSSVAMESRYLTLGKTLWQDIGLTLPVSNEADAEQVKQVGQTTASSTEPANIELPEVWIPLDVDIEQIDIQRFIMNGDSPMKVNHLGLSAKAADHHVTIRSILLDMPEIDADLEGSIDLQAGYPLDVQLNAALKEGDLNGQTLALSANGSVEHLGLDARFGGVVEALLKGELEPLNSDLPFDAKLTKGKLQWPLKGKPGYQAQIESLALHGSLSGYDIDTKLAAQGTDIPDLDLQLSGAGSLEYIDLKLLKLGALGGQVIGETSAHWAEQVRWQANIGLENIQPGLQWPELQGAVSGNITTVGHLTEQGGWYVELPLLALQGDLRGYPLLVNGDVIAQDVSGKGDLKLVTESLSIAHGPNTVFASGQLDKTWQLDLDLKFPDFAKSLPELSGNMLGKIELRGELEQPDVFVDIAINDTNWNQEASLEELTLQGQIQPLPVPKGDVTLAAKNMAYQGQVIDSVDLRFKGDEQDHQLTLDLLSDIASASVKVAGALQQEPHLVWSGALERAKLTSEQGTWQLDHSTSITFDGKSNLANVDAHCWQQADSQLCLTESIQAGESGEVNLTLSAFNFDQIKMFLPKNTELTGGVDGQVWAKWAPDEKPQVKATIDLPKGQVVQKLENPLTLGWDKITIKTELKNNQLFAQWLFDLTDNGDVQGQASIDKVLADDRTIDGNLKISQIDLNALKPLIGEFSEVNANIHSDLRFSGPVLHPELYGDFTIDDLVAKGEITPVNVDLGKLVVALNGYAATVNASLATPDGTLDITGDGDWSDLSAWKSNVRIFAEELNVNLPPMVQIKVKPDMVVTATPEEVRIDGDISLPWGRIDIQELPEAAIGVSSDEVLLDDNFEVVKNDSALPMNIVTNINISIGDDFELKAFGLESGLKGKLKVSQKDNSPYIVGEVNLIDGTYRSFGQDLQIKQGKILMNGPADQPYVSIEAIRNPDNTRDDVTAGIRVTGSASEPTVTIFSDPSMQQANALSYLLRGQDIDAETGGNMMTTTLIGLSLAKSGKVVGEIGQAFGVQDLQLDTAGSGDDSQVTVSGYILPGLQVKYGMGIFNSLGEFTVRYRLMTDLYLEAVSGVTSAVDLLYQFEFD